ncbi:MAG: hypothetical protein WC671_00550 [Candidatus Paceibacterota bacterium]|jgi:hypothetical protein
MTQKEKQKIVFRSLHVNFGDMVVTIHEMSRGGVLYYFFNNFGRFKEISFPSEEEVEEFCQEHPDKLAPKLFSTFFLCKREKRFIVIRVVVKDFQKIDLEEISLRSKEEWSPWHRVVVVVPPKKSTKQQTAVLVATKNKGGSK